MRDLSLLGEFNKRLNYSLPSHHNKKICLCGNAFCQILEPLHEIINSTNIVQSKKSPDHFISGAKEWHPRVEQPVISEPESSSA